MASAQLAPKFDPQPEQQLSPKLHRIRSGISLDAICERTKISRYFLEAIEERAYHRLPGGVFDVNYIRQYSESVGCDADLILTDYQSVSQAAGASKGVAPKGVPGKGWWQSLRTFFSALAWE